MAVYFKKAVAGVFVSSYFLVWFDKGETQYQFYRTAEELLLGVADMKTRPGEQEALRPWAAKSRPGDTAFFSTGLVLCTVLDDLHQSPTVTFVRPSKVDILRSENQDLRAEVDALKARVADLAAAVADKDDDFSKKPQ